MAPLIQVSARVGSTRLCWSNTDRSLPSKRKKKKGGGGADAEEEAGPAHLNLIRVLGAARCHGSCDVFSGLRRQQPAVLPPHGPKDPTEVGRVRVRRPTEDEHAGVRLLAPLHRGLFRQQGQVRGWLRDHSGSEGRRRSVHTRPFRGAANPACK